MLVLIACSVLLLIAVVDGKTLPAASELDGMWCGTTIEHDGEVLADDSVRAVRLEIKNGDITVWRANRSRPAYRLHAILRPDCSPKQMDCTQAVGAGEELFFPDSAAIYELRGERLVVCTHPRDYTVRPASFAAGPNDHQVLATFVRLQPGELP